MAKGRLGRQERSSTLSRILHGARRRPKTELQRRLEKAKRR